MMNLFVLSRVVSNIKKRLPELPCLVLEKALLWLICGPVVDQYVAEDLKRKVLSEWKHVRGNDVDAELNPIKQMAVVVLGNHGAVYVDMFGNLEEENAGGGGVVPQDKCINPKPVVGSSVAFACNATGKFSVEDRVDCNKVYLERGFEVVNGKVWRFALQPARQFAAPVVVDGGAEADVGAANDLVMITALKPTPIRLHDLLSEYLHGVGGRKSVRLFSHTEQGCTKHRYIRWKVAWDAVSGLVRQGRTSELAINKIYGVYGGQMSVTKIINGLKRDKKEGTLSPNLTI